MFSRKKAARPEHTETRCVPLPPAMNNMQERRKRTLMGREARFKWGGGGGGSVLEEKTFLAGMTELKKKSSLNAFVKVCFYKHVFHIYYSTLYF